MKHSYVERVRGSVHGVTLVNRYGVTRLYVSPIRLLIFVYSAVR